MESNLLSEFQTIWQLLKIWVGTLHSSVHDVAVVRPELKSHTQLRTQLNPLLVCTSRYCILSGQRTLVPVYPDSLSQCTSNCWGSGLSTSTGFPLSVKQSLLVSRYSLAMLRNTNSDSRMYTPILFLFLVGTLSNLSINYSVTGVNLNEPLGHTNRFVA